MIATAERIVLLKVTKKAPALSPSYELQNRILPSEIPSSVPKLRKEPPSRCSTTDLNEYYKPCPPPSKAASQTKRAIITGGMYIYLCIIATDQSPNLSVSLCVHYK